MKRLTSTIHSLVKSMHLEELFSSLGSRFPLFTKFIPLPNLYRHENSIKVRRDKVNFDLQRDDYMQWHVYANIPDHSYEIASQLINHKELVLDIGANIGAFSLKLAHRLRSQGIPDANIVAFEPNPMIAERFANNLQLNPELMDMVELCELGLGKEKGSFPIIYDAQNTGGAKFDLELSSLQTTVMAHMDTLDSWAKSRRIDGLSFMKVDIEGHEPYFLEGAENTIKHYRPSIYMEMTDDWFLAKGWSSAKIIKWLQNLNYNLYVDWKNTLIPVEDWLRSHQHVQQYNILAKQEIN